MPKKPKKEMVRSPKGMRDMLEGDVRYLEKISEKARSVAEFYGFHPIKTPHLEHVELFSRPLGEASDVVEKEMYTLRTKGGDHLALRPEGTAAIARAYHENGMSSWPHPVKLYYEGSFFRHDKPQRGRYREHTQFGTEVLGGEEAVIDALIIKIFYITLFELGLKNVLVHINSLGDKNCRPTYVKELASYYKKKFNYLCKDCKRRLKENPLRMLDCKEPGCAELKAQAPQALEHLCQECKTHFKSVLEFLDEGEIPYFLDHALVRGFDYYGRTVFEIFSENEERKSAKPEGAENSNGEEAAAEKHPAVALGSGGRYDELMSLLGGKALPAAGGALGMDRIMQAMKDKGIGPKVTPRPKVFLIQIGPAAKKRSFTLMEELRKAGIFVGESLSRDNLRAQLNVAVKFGAKVVLILGQKEAMQNTIILRYMDEGTQEDILQKKLIDKLKEKLSARGGSASGRKRK